MNTKISHLPFVRDVALPAALLLALLACAPAVMAQDDFSLKYPLTDTTLPDDLTIVTTKSTNGWLAGLSGGYLELTDDQPSRTAALVIDTLPKNQFITRLRTKFDVRMSKAAWSDVPADGFSINFGPDIAATTVRGQDGITNGLSISFDTYDNGASDPAPAIKVLYNGKRYGGAAFLNYDGSTNNQTDLPTKISQELITTSAGGAGTYKLIARGAQGGADINNNGASSHSGGNGAEMTGTVHLVDGDVLTIRVGGRGEQGKSSHNNPAGGGGGGGSFIVLNGSTPLLVAGGGGGAASGANGHTGTGGSGQTSANGSAGYNGGSDGGGGGIDGGGGGNGTNPNNGAGGAGYYGDGGWHDGNAQGGTSYVKGSSKAGMNGNESNFGGFGGFGGGGQGGLPNITTDAGGGGGGGWSGGGGGGTKAGGGGGGSHHDGSVTLLGSSSGTRSGDGEVVIITPDGKTNIFSSVGENTFTVPITGTNFYPVAVEIGPDPNGTGNVVSVWWNNQKVLANVALPSDYNPPANWNMAIGAATGGKAETHHFRNLEISGSTKLPVTVITPYGHESSDFYPPAGVHWLQSLSSVDVTAPPVLWLDQFMQLLPADQNDRAFYKAECTGADINGVANPNTAFTLQLQEKTVIKWQYAIHNLGEVHSGTESVPDLSPTDITDPAHTDTLGRRFLPIGDESFDSVVFSSINNDQGDAKSGRFNSKGYVMENAPGSPERFLQLAGEGDYLRSQASVTNYPGTAVNGSFSVDFWARVNPDEPANAQTIFGYGSLQVGFGTDRGIFMAVGASVSGAPGGWTDDSWHHWAIVNDKARNAVMIYRDATLIVSNSPALSGFTGGPYVMTVGAYESAGVPGDFFSGGINNLRFWRAALERTDIANSLTTIQYGTTRTNTLELEMSFDAVPVLPVISGVYVEQVDVTNVLLGSVGVGGEYQNSWPSSMAAESSLVQTSLVRTTFSLPSTNEVPSLGRPVYWRLQSRWTGLPDQPEVGFTVNSDSDTLVFMDYQLVARVKGTNQISQQNFKVTPGEHLLTIFKADTNANRTLSLNISRYNSSYSLNSGNDLYVNTRGLLDLGAVTNTSTEGDQHNFTVNGVGELMPLIIKSNQLISAVMPGFQLGLAEPGASSQSIDSDGKAPLYDWRRVFWGWNKQFSYKVSVTSTDNDGLDAARYLPFFRTELTTIDGVDSISSGTLGQGVVDVLELWLSEGEQLTVGTIYRTSDRKFTLSGISGQQAMFGEFGLDDLVDGTYSNAFDAGSTREYTFPAVTGPGTLIFQYARTIHRAHLPLGHGLDVSTLASVNALLTPPLPVGATNLEITLQGPSVSDDTPQTGGTPGGDGTGWAWDYYSRKWYPTKPGVYTLTWSDQKKYANTIEVSSDFPTESATRSGFNAWEAPDGSRLGVAPDYTYTNVYAGVVTNYPGAPYAHYSYALAPEGSYRADLDPSGIDNTKLTRMSYAEGNSAQLASSRIFTDTVPSNRSVLVFSSRPNAGQIATGDATREYVTVRVMQSVTSNNTDSAVVGQKIDPASDAAGLGSGQVTIDSGNYNVNIYNPGGDVGKWGPIYPVNRNFTNKLQLTVGWYYNPNGVTNTEPVAYIPAISTTYTNIAYPDASSADVIYISSQMGSEGVGQAIATNGAPNYQTLFNPTGYASVAIYNQPDKDANGYNPNEEHAFIAPSKAYQLTGDSRFNLGQNAAFALQNKINPTNDYTSDPFVLVQYSVPGATNASAAYGMRIYTVQAVRTNATAQTFPNLDPETHTAFTAAGQPVAQPANPRYDFEYVAIAGTPVVPPYPLNLAIGNVVLTNTPGGNIGPQRALWQDRTGNRWVVSGDGSFFQRYRYPMRPDFWLGGGTLPAGTTIAWAPENVGEGDYDAFKNASTLAVASRYATYWGDDYPVLKKGETLTYAGGEYKADHPASEGLPAVLNMASAEVVYDSAVPSMRMTISVDLESSYLCRYVRFRPNENYSDPSYTQYGEFEFYDADGKKLIPSTASSSGSIYSGSTSNTMDGDYNNFVMYKHQPALVFDFGSNVSTRSYAWWTGGYAYDDYNPISWIVETSLDGTNWVQWDAHEKYPVSTNIATKVGPFDFNLTQYAYYPYSNTFARVTRPLDRLSTRIAQAEMPVTLQPANPSKVQVDGSRWYFKDLSASLGKRFYYDSLAGELVFRGRLNDLESGSPDLTRQPVQPYVLEPNFLTEENVELLKDLPGSSITAWNEAVEHLHDAASTEFTTGTDFGLGVVAATSRTDLVDLPFYDPADLINPVTNGIGDLVPVSSLGIGSALVATPHFLEENPAERTYITLAENNDTNVNSAVALHIIELAQERYRGSINVITPQNAFDDKIELKHTGDFGGNTAEVFYQWYVRDVCDLAAAGTPGGTNAEWQLYQQGLGLNSITFSGRPDITLADKFFFMRYGGKEELSGFPSNSITSSSTNILDASWRDVPPDAENPDWSRTNNIVPFQWAGAANSPQLQADGSKRYLPQLVMGWVKRVLDAINLFEARYSATFSGDAPATYASMLQEAGGPYIGPVALNPDKDNLENTGLIALYETILARAKELTDGLNNTAGTDQALLLAATRLSYLYQLLGSEAFSDAQNFVVPQSPTASTPLSTDAFAFKNAVANPLQEELALLRGTDFLKAYPAYNRLFWNYFKADGEAYYNANYNIHDVNNNGLIDESDAAILYPMGHGDAWGHYLSATKMHYELLRRAGYVWLARSELYSLLGNVLPVDFLDEKTFATIAADKIRTGAAILKSTYRDAYVADPDGQWQGYEDTAQPARAWGLSEWSRRVGQGAWFDWLAVNAVTPAPSTNVVEGLAKIDRTTVAAEIGSVAAGLAEVQETVDQANRGLNPLGLDSDAMAFDAAPFYDGIAWEQITPFQQSLDKALKAAENAQAAYEFASQADQQLRRIADDTRALQEQAILQDLDYRNRLIGLYGTPYQGTIGPGKIFAEGYTGPDLLTYMYLDNSTVDEATPSAAWSDGFNANLTAVQGTSGGLNFFNGPLDFNPETIDNIMANFYLDGSSSDGIIWATEGEDYDTSGQNVIITRLPLETTADYAFTAPEEWGRRMSPGEIQAALEEMLAAELDLNLELLNQNTAFNKVKMLTYNANLKLKAIIDKHQFEGDYQGILTSLELTRALLTKFGDHLQKEVKGRPQQGDYAKLRETEALRYAIPGGAFDYFFALRAALIDAQKVVEKAESTATFWLDIGAAAAESSAKITELAKDAEGETFSQYNECVATLNDLAQEYNNLWVTPQPVLATKIQALNMAASHVRSIIAEAERLVEERTALNKQIAAKAQRNRYADLITRVNRSDAMRKYDLALDNAARYAWLAVKAYDYETSLSEGHPAAAGEMLEEIVKTRSLGNWSDGEPRGGAGGLAEILHNMSANYNALKGQIGLNNGQGEANLLSLRTEMMRISPDATSDERWKDALAGARVADLWKVPEFREYCRPFAAPASGPQPGLVIEFSTEITSGKNFFGRPLSGLDHAFSPANYATKVRSFTAAFPGYDDDGTLPQLSISPRFYLVPAGLDMQYCSDTLYPEARSWNVVSQRIPVPFPVNTSKLGDLNYSPNMDGVDGSYAERIRFGDSRAFITDNGLTGADDMLQSPLTPGWNSSSRLYGRSVWNTRWLLILPGATLSADKDKGLDRFINTVTDVKLYLETYSNQGM